MSRAEQLIPDGWKPRVGSVVIVEGTKDDPAPPHGVWKVISAAPGAGQWWLLPAGDAAREWLERFPGQRHVGGCITRPGRVLLPKGTRRPRSSDLSPAELARMAGGRR